MKHPFHDDEVQRLREQLRERIDVAAKSVAEVLQVATDLLLAIPHWEVDPEADAGTIEARPIAEMMTPEQAADYLGVKAQTLAVWRSTRRYSLPFVKVGRNIRYRKGDLDKFLQRRTENRGCEDD
jgi:excisionase family DNA binding protein